MTMTTPPSAVAVNDESKATPTAKTEIMKEAAAPQSAGKPQPIGSIFAAATGQQPQQKPTLAPGAASVPPKPVSAAPVAPKPVSAAPVPPVAVPPVAANQTAYGRLDRLIDAYPMPTWRPYAWTVSSLMALFLVWSVFARLDEVAIAPGEVVPFGRVKQIQHLEGGVLRELYVREGDEVKEGAPLFQVDLPASALNRDELQVRLDGQVLARARLQAEANQAPLTFPPEEAKRQPSIRQTEQNSYEARKSELESTLNKLNEQIRQRTLDVQEFESKRKTSLAGLKLAKEKLRMSTSLLKDSLTSKIDHITTEREVETLEGEVAGLESAIPRSRAALAEAQERIREERFKFTRDAREQLSTKENEIARTRELLSQAAGQALRSQIQSPIDGIVKNLRYNTLGGVIKPGDTIMEIVPLKDKLIIEGKLNPIDRGYVEAGQKALVKISTYDYARYGGLYGQVVLVAPDTTTEQGVQNPQPYYRVVAETDKNYLGSEVGSLPITPGMIATIEIHTGTKTVMEYLVKPVIKLKHEAFRER
jgi:adhesin transport system membrane fusion protein